VIAAGAILAVAAASAAATGPQTGPGAGPDAAYTGAHGGKRNLSLAGLGAWNSRSAWGAPQRWLAYSRDCFQRVMWMLADRSAGLQGPYGPETGETRRGRPGPPPGYDPVPARWPDARQDDDDDQERPRREREERPDREQSDWPGETHPRCHRAGAVVRRGGWYVVRQGDTLWGIAEAHYGDGGAWRRILRANWRTVPDASCIYACQRLYIPPPPRWDDDRPPAQRPWSEPNWRSRPDPEWSDQSVGTVRLLGPRGCSDCGAGSHGPDRSWR
jgi:nucleoid-associated protein YgaU